MRPIIVSTCEIDGCDPVAISCIGHRRGLAHLDIGPIKLRADYRQMHAIVEAIQHWLDEDAAAEEAEADPGPNDPEVVDAAVCPAGYGRGGP